MKLIMECELIILAFPGDRGSLKWLLFRALSFMLKWRIPARRGERALNVVSQATRKGSRQALDNSMVLPMNL